MKSIKRLIVAIVVVIIAAVTLTACNKTMFDIQYTFTKAHIRVNDVWFDVDVVKWCDYDGEQIQLQLTDGTVIVMNSRDCILYNGNLPTGA